jgi:hypothetical protein
MMAGERTERIALLDAFLGALDEWGCADEDRAEAIIDFIDGGYNLSEYEDRAKLRVITGGSP